MYLDLVTEESAKTFTYCYERFIAEHGRCDKMFSDNGTHFVATSKVLKNALNNWVSREMLDHLHSKGTEWQFMTPAARIYDTRQGAIYEAAVK